MFDKIKTEAPETGDPRPLFAIAIEYYDVSGKVTPNEPTHANIVYTNAATAREAEFMYRAANSAKFLSGEMRIVSVAEPVGWFVQDEHGEELAG
jgi:hypothetical protein